MLASLPAVFLGLLLLSPFVGGVAHAVFYLEHLRQSYGPWAEYGFGVLLIVLIVFGIEYWQVLVFGLIPVVGYCWWMTS